MTPPAGIREGLWKRLCFSRGLKIESDLTGRREPEWALQAGDVSCPWALISEEQLLACGDSSMEEAVMRLEGARGPDWAHTVSVSDVVGEELLTNCTEESSAGAL